MNQRNVATHLLGCGTGIGISVLLLSASAHGQACPRDAVCQTFGPADVAGFTYISQAHPTQSFWTAPNIRVEPEAGAVDDALLFFDLSRLDPGAEVRSAALTLRIQSGWDPFTVTAAAATTPWRSDATWDSSGPPACGPGKLGLVLGETQTFDVRDLASDWINLASPNYGFVLRGGSAAYGSHTSEAPTLTVCYVPGPPS